MRFKQYIEQNTRSITTVPGDYVPAVLTHSDGGISDCNIIECISTTFEIVGFYERRTNVEPYMMQLVHNRQSTLICLAARSRGMVHREYLIYDVLVSRHRHKSHTSPRWVHYKVHATAVSTFLDINKT